MGGGPGGSLPSPHPADQSAQSAVPSSSSNFNQYLGQDRRQSDTLTCVSSRPALKAVTAQN